MKATLVLVAFLAGVALAQAAAAAAPGQDASDGLALTASVKGLAGADLAARARCLLKVGVQVVEFLFDIPRNCLDLSQRAMQTQGIWEGLYVLPSCVVYSLAAAVEMVHLMSDQCAEA